MSKNALGNNCCLNMFHSISPYDSNRMQVLQNLICCFFFLFTADKAAACQALNSSLDVLNATLLDCNIDCCTGNKCNNQYFTVIPTIPGQTTPSAFSPTTRAQGNVRTYTCKKEIQTFA